MNSFAKLRLIYGTSNLLFGPPFISWLRSQGYMVYYSKSIQHIERLLSRRKVDLIILDDSIARGENLNISLMRLIRYQRNIIIILNAGDIRALQYISIREVKGIISRTGNLKELRLSIQCACRGEYYYSKLIFGRMWDSRERQKCSASQLTKREWEICRMLSEGLSRPVIAESLYISKRTVDRHMQNIRIKLNLGRHIWIRSYISSLLHSSE
jgi:DNA-binding NarL/FixJ family response regulator